MTRLTSWGRLQAPHHKITTLTDPDAVAGQLRGGRRGIAVGLGRSYGDVALSPGGRAWRTAGLNRLVSFDGESGRLMVESGVSLAEIQRIFRPRGWGLPVVPGTAQVTVGGAIANDVHGKNHHTVGSFGNHVLALQLARSDGSLRWCTPDTESGLFAATIGGLGLTGIIVRAELQLQREPGAWMETDSVAFGELADYFDLARMADAYWEHTVAWVDCSGPRAGRGIFQAGRSVAGAAGLPAERPHRRVPFTPPASLVTGATTRIFNALYYAKHSATAGRRAVPADQFLHPLDAVRDWNRLYGPRGFYQYQCVIPPQSQRDAIAELLREVARRGQGSALTVLKTFGERPAAGLLSFPRPGATLALDLPNKGMETLRLLQCLDVIVAQCGGALYAAKDARMSASMFRQGYPQLENFMQYRDPGMSSGLSRRLIEGST